MEPSFTAKGASGMFAGSRQAIRVARSSHLEPRVAPSSSRFITQSHALSTPMARPRSLFLAATIAFGLYLVGRRLSD